MLFALQRQIGSGILLAVLLALAPLACGYDLSHSRIVLSTLASPVERQAARMLEEEVRKRTALDWRVSDGPGDTRSRIVLADRSQLAAMLKKGLLRNIRLPAFQAPEAFAVRVLEPSHTILIVGADERGVLFGVGYLLRHLEMTPLHATTRDLASINTTPAYSVRGHQLGYRPKNNTFDAWTPAQFEQYIRDLAIFGTNTIEIIPPRSDDDVISPLFTLPPMQMMIQLSRIIDRYGLNCSIWYPALDKDYSDPATVDAAVAEWGAVFDQLPRIDALFVPGGDPGHTEPKYLLALLEKEAARLRQRHPRAQVWVSPQSFSAQWLEEFYALLAKNPPWLTGVVYGPEMRDSPGLFRRRVPAHFPIRFYPDITHVLDAQYPVPDWDPAFALTEGREPINPRPADESTLFHRYAPLTTGFVAYSEGSNDDVNKVLWSGWGWNPKQPAATILTEYARLFLSSPLSVPIASAITGLEANWRGPVESNRSIQSTLSQLRAIEQHDPTLARTNWRLQQLLYRGYYDAYTQQRAQREQKSQRESVALLETSPLTDAALDAAARALSNPANCSNDPLCQHLLLIADDLFHSIGMQLSVARYHALAVDRGANLDQVDAPLSDAIWLRAQIAMARGEPNSKQRSSIITHALELLGHAGAAQADLLGETAHAPHLLRGTSFDEDPSGLKGTYLGVNTSNRVANLPLAWRTFAGTLYDHPLELSYQDMEPHQACLVQVHSDTDVRHLSLLVNGTSIAPVCANDSACLDATYPVPADLLPTHEMHLAFRGEQGRGGNGRTVALSTVKVTQFHNTSSH